MGTSGANVVSWCVDGPTTLYGYDDDLVYMLVRADTDDPDLQREVALVSAWDLEGERYAPMIAAVPKLLAACQAVVDRWEHGDLAEAARMCSEAVKQPSARKPARPPWRRISFSTTGDTNAEEDARNRILPALAGRQRRQRHMGHGRCRNPG